MRLLPLILTIWTVSVHAQGVSDEVVRVHLLASETVREAQISAIQGPLEVVADGSPAGVVNPGQNVTVRYRNGIARVEGRGLSVSGARLEFDGGAFGLRVGRTDRSYRGAARVFAASGSLILVNHVPMEPYVASVVASELGFDVPEANKAQAVLARTFAARRLGGSGTHDLTDNTGSQVYRGMETVTEVTQAAAEATAGEVLTYRGELAEATYYSSSGGYTADNDAVWNGEPVPYLRAVPDPYDRVSPFSSWESTPSRRAVHDALSSRFGGRVTDVRVIQRSRSGRVQRVRLVGAHRSEVSGNQFRSAINASLGWRTVKSTKFELSQRGDRYVLRGSGFGHGVGMSQYGAIGQARDGRSYQEILAFYFSGTTLNTRRAPIQVAQATPAPRVDTPTVGNRPVRRYPTPRRIARRPAVEAPSPARQARTAAPRRTAW
ncbi:MAG: SpoIID/LytB domain-containing protein [Bacteroidota bacterium]